MKIIQIIPATTEIWAMLELEEVKKQVHLWALYENEDGEREISGMVAGEWVELAEDSHNFLGYTTQG